MKNLSTKVDSDTYDEFIDSCNNSGNTPSEELRELVKNSLTNGSSYDMQEPKEVIKEVIKEVKVPVEIEKIVEKRVEVPVIQKQFIEKIVEVPKITAPEHLPAYTCSEGCNHSNKNYKKRVRSKCSNCDQFNKLETGSCAWCGSKDLEPIDKDELEQLSIPLPNHDGNPSEPYKCPNSNCEYSVSTHGI